MAKRVYLSPSDQRRNTYAVGDTTEAIQCGRIAEACKAALERSGVEVMLGQYDTMQNRVAASTASRLTCTSLFIPTPATARPAVRTCSAIAATGTAPGTRRVRRCWMCWGL